MKKLFAKILILTLVLSLVQIPAVMQVSAEEQNTILAIEEDTYSNYYTNNTTSGEKGYMEIGDNSTTALSADGKSFPVGYMKFKVDDGFRTENGKAITSAKLKFYATSSRNETNRTATVNSIYFYKAHDAWHEVTNATDNIPALSWDRNAANVNVAGLPSGTTISFDNSGTYTPDFISTTEFAVNTDYYQLYEIDVTELLKSYATSSADPYISFAMTAKTSWYRLHIATKEAPADKDLEQTTNSSLYYKYWDGTSYEEDGTTKKLTDLVSGAPWIELTVGDAEALKVTNTPETEIDFTKESYDISYNYPIDESTVTPANITLTENGQAVTLTEDNFSVEGSTVSISYDWENMSNYTLAISSDVKDIFGRGLDLSYPFTTKTPTSVVTVDKSAFTTGRYLVNDSEGTSTGEAEGTTIKSWRLYENSTFYEVYYSVDISSLAGKSIKDVILNMAVSKQEVDFQFYKLSPDAVFTCGTTAKKDLPVTGDKFASFKIEAVDSLDNGGYRMIEVDVTEYVRELVMSGKTKMNFVLKSGTGSSVQIMTKNTYAAYPNNTSTLTATCEDAVYLAGGSAIASENVPVTSDIKATFTTDIEEPAASDVVLMNVTDGVQNTLTDEEISYDLGSRTVIINPSADLLYGKKYMVEIDATAVVDSTVTTTVLFEFTTPEAPVVIGDITISGDDTKTATVLVSNYTDEDITTYKLLFCAYSGNRLEKVSLVGENIKVEAGKSAPFETELTGVSGLTIKAFLWDFANDGIAPLK